MARETRKSGLSVDARVRRTRQRLETAIIELCIETGFNEITIEDILKRADVSRPAFYSHYPDRYALLDAALENALDALRTDSSEALDRVGTLAIEPTEALFESAARNAPAMRVLLSGAGDGKPLRRAIASTAEDMEPGLLRQADEAGTSPRLPADLIAAHWASTFFAVLEWWLERHPELTPAVVADHHLNLALRGRAWALGFDISKHEISRVRRGGERTGMASRNQL